MRTLLVTLLINVLLLICIEAQGSREILIVNNCQYDFYFKVTSGSAPTIRSIGVTSPPASLLTCTSNSQCVAGSSCLSPPGLCFWNVNTPSSGNFEVPAGRANSVTFPYYNNNVQTLWSGNFGFCRGASCSSSSSVCSAKGCNVVNGASNIAEITLQKNYADFYDISNIGGFNVPMSFGPTNLPPSMLEISTPYTCGTPGLPIEQNGIGASSWSAIPPYVQNYWVKGTGGSCTSSSQCTNGTVCGVDTTPSRVPNMNLMCGELYGMWTANALCSQDPQFSLSPDPFLCSSPIQNGPYSTTVGQLYLCDGTSGSGYSDGADEYSCGCENWWETGLSVPPSPATPLCVNSAPAWTEYVLPSISWLKEACPSCYTYPYDDKSSSFTCSNFEGATNTQNYTLTLCPLGTSAQITRSSVSATYSPTHSPTLSPTLSLDSAASVVDSSCIFYCFILYLLLRIFKISL